MKLTAEQIYKARLDFYYYERLMYDIVYGVKMREPAHLKLGAKNLERVFVRKCARLIKNRPTGYLKSIEMCLFITWAHGWYPDSKSIGANFSSDVAVKTQTTHIKQIVRTPEYRQIFPNFEIGKPKKSEMTSQFRGLGLDQSAYFETTAGGFFMCGGFKKGVGGLRVCRGITHRFDGLLWIDDPHDLKGGMNSEAERNNVKEDYRSKWKSRVNTTLDPIVVTMQRLDHDDLCGYLQREDGSNWEIEKVKALTEDNKSTWEWKYPTDFLLKERETNTRVFFAQYQQEPSLEHGNLVSVDSITELDELPKLKGVYLSVDPSMSDKEASDPWGFVTFGQFGTKHVIIESFAKRVGLNPGIGLIVDKVKENGISAVLVEEKALGFELIKGLKAEFSEHGIRCNVIAINEKNTPLTKSKVLRMVDANETVDGGNVFVYKFGAGCMELMQKLSVFPESGDDHECDCFSQYLNYFKRKPEIKRFEIRRG